MPIACQEYVFWIGEGDRDVRKKEESLAYRVEIGMRLGALVISQLLMP
jgi:hypothetical protein